MRRKTGRSVRMRRSIARHCAALPTVSRRNGGYFRAVRTDFPAFFIVLVDFLSGVASRQRGAKARMIWTGRLAERVNRFRETNLIEWRNSNQRDLIQRSAPLWRASRRMA